MPGTEVGQCHLGHSSKRDSHQVVEGDHFVDQVRTVARHPLLKAKRVGVARTVRVMS